ncbi:MAG: acyl carrier protein [Rhodospirillales bacterium]
MQTEEIYATLGEVFRDVFGPDAPDPVPEMTADDVDGWDSLNHVRLIIAVERAFSIRFSTREISGLKNVGDLTAVVEKKKA